MAYAYAVDPKTAQIAPDPFGVVNPYDPIARTHARTSETGPPDLAEAGPQTSDLLAQVMAELQAQQAGAPSPRERDLQLQMLRGGQ